MKIKSNPIQYFLLGMFLFFTTSSIRAQKLNKEILYTQHKFIPFYNLKKAGNTTIFQGNKKKKNYFEGWYFKMVAKDGSSILSIIPGISLSSDGKEQHAFIQIINGITAQTSYYSFPIEEFSFSKKEFAMRIADNYFSKDSICIHIKDDNSSVSGKVRMTHQVKYKSDRLFNTGIMGPYRFVPFMECYHGVVSLTHNLSGKLIIQNEVHDFEGGKGYIEKDWGSSMPSAWIWMQSNHFNDTNSSFMLSIADIPWLGKSFTGFLGFYYQNNKIHHFATYRPTKLQLEIADSNQLKIRIENKKNTFIINAISNNKGMLKAPVEGAMDRRIPESIDAILKITMMDKEGSILFMDSTNIAGLEMVGDYLKLQGLLK
jgi:tocopherol cyclase